MVVADNGYGIEKIKLSEMGIKERKRKKKKEKLLKRCFRLVGRKQLPEFLNLRGFQCTKFLDLLNKFL